MDKIGVIFDEDESTMLTELIEYYKTDVYNLLCSSIDTMYQLMIQEKTNND